MRDEKVENGASKTRGAEKVLPWLWVAFWMLFQIFFLCRHVDKLIDNDASSELVLGHFLSSGWGIISKSWNYSTEIRFLNNQIIFSFFFHFLKDWHTVRILSSIVLYLILAGSFYYLSVQAGLKRYFPVMMPFLLLPISEIYSDIILIGLYYIPHIVISFLSVGLILHIEKCYDGTKYAPDNKTLVLTGALCLLAVLAGMGGPRQLMVLYIPLTLAGLWLWYKEKRFRFPGIYLSAVFSAVGYLLNMIFLDPNYKFNDFSTVVNYKGFSVSSIDRLIGGVLMNLGFAYGEFRSLATVRNGICFVLLFALLIYFIYCCKHSETLPVEERLITAYFLLSILIFFMLYIFTDMIYEDRYTLPMMVFLYLFIGFSLKGHGWRKITKIIFAMGISALLIVQSGAVYKNLASVDKNADLRAAAEECSRMGYSAGYATFWQSNILTEFSDGALEMYIWDTDVSSLIDVNDLMRWLQVKEHFEKTPEGKVFILLKRSELETCPLARYLAAQTPVVDLESLVVYGFENYEEMLKAVSTYSYDLGKADWLSGGVCDGESWLMGPYAASSGPVMTFYPGTYEVRITGDNLDALGVLFTSDFNEHILESELIQAGDSADLSGENPSDGDTYHSSTGANEELVYHVYVEDTAYFVQFLLSNPTEENIRITSVSAARR